jgi:hypothetical protein
MTSLLAYFGKRCTEVRVDKRGALCRTMSHTAKSVICRVFASEAMFWKVLMTSSPATFVRCFLPTKDNLSQGNAPQFARYRAAPHTSLCGVKALLCTLSSVTRHRTLKKLIRN